MAYTNIDDSSVHFQNATYTGNGSTQSITNDGNSDLQPDLLWIKSRSDSSFHAWTDSTRGTSKRIYSNSTAAEESHTDRVTAFNNDGFSLGGSSLVNTNTYNYAAWQWKANGGTTSTDTNGSITSTVQANTDAGFSIVTWAGTSSAETIGHGLGVAPKFLIVKARDSGVPTSWAVFHKDGSTSDDDVFVLQSTGAKISAYAGLWNNQYPSSTVFGVSNDLWLNSAGTNYIAYCFAEKQGYSKFGKYVGNGSSDGPFVYTGFKPAFVILKGSSASGSWYMLDSKRDVDNVAHHAVEAQSAAAEYTNYNFIDMLSNGFKLRLGTSEVNTSGNSYIYMAFAENPFTTSTGIPTTAR